MSTAQVRKHRRKAAGKEILTVLRYAAVVAGASVALIAQNVIADDSTLEVWLNPGIFSYHFNRDRNLREDNIGFGAEVHLNPRHVLMVGTYINSDRDRTRYAAYQWRPLHWQPMGIDLSAGVLIGVFDGYPQMRGGGWFVAPLPVLALEGRRVGMNFAVIPTISDHVQGAVAVQVKLRVW